MKTTVLNAAALILLLNAGAAAAQNNEPNSTSIPTDTVAATRSNHLPFQFGFVNNPQGYEQASCQLSLLTNNFNGFVHGFQGALISNSTDKLAGTQLSTIYNTTRGDVKGFQGSVIFNTTSNLEGGQMTAIFNKANNVVGIQGAAIANFACGKMEGYQVSGILNRNSNRATGLQAAGIVNVADTITGAQVSGIVNTIKEIKGAQVAGFVNKSNSAEGAQVAGFLNKAKKVKGVQVGLINIADSCDGVQVGLLNIAKTGYRQVEVSGDELFYANVAFRSGVKQLHGILTAGIRPDYTSKTIWTYGYGVGTSQNIGKKTMLDADISYSQIVIDDDFDAANCLSRIYVGIDQYVCKHFSIAFGVTANVATYQADDLNNLRTMQQIIPYTIFKENFDHNKREVAGWIGGKIALRFN